MLRVLAVTNIFPTPAKPSSGTFVQQQVKGLREAGIEVDVMFVDRASEGTCAYFGLERRVRLKVKQHQPDLVHVMYGGVMADAVTRAVDNRLVVISFCGSDLLGEMLSGTVRKFISRYGVLASHKAARRASGIIVKSKNLQQALPRDVSLSKVRIIPNGIDLGRFKPLDRTWCRKRLGFDNRQFHVLFPANSGDPVKRPELARAAVDCFSRTGAVVNMHELSGVPHDEVPIWLNACDVLLLTSLHEGSPNIIKESLACDLPVVSVDVGDVRERIQGISGCHLAKSDVTDLAAKLQLVHARAGRILAHASMQALSLGQVAQRLKNFYLELLSSHRSNAQR